MHPELNKLHKSGSWLRRWTRKLNHAAVLGSNELLYERLFSNALHRFDLQNRYYPIKSAANYSLLYLILRIVTELPVHRVLELGCGQTTLLLDALRTQREFEVLTLEHDRDWANRMQKSVAHPITVAPLCERMVHGHTTLTYDISPDALGAPVDLLIVDGPIGNRRKSRWGCLELLSGGTLNNDYVVIFDDAQRKGELDTIRVALKLLAMNGQRPSIGVTQALSSQCVIATGCHAEASYY